MREIIVKSPGSFSLRFILKLFVSVVCMVGLLVQTSYLIDEYMSGRTIVNIRYRRLRRETIPSFTICYPCYMSMEKAGHLNPELGKVYDEYKIAIDSMISANEQANNDKSKQLYSEVYHSIATKTADSMPVLHMFEKLSIPFHWVNSTGKFQAIEVRVHGIHHQSNGNMKYVDVMDDEPIESMSAEYQANCMRKCYTFFSALNRKWRDYELELDYITIQVNHDNNWFPPSIYNKDTNEIFFAMHSPNILPTLMNGENFLIVHTQNRYLLTYTQIITELLDKRFDTNCHNYDLDDNITHVNMRSDCVSLCKLKAMKSVCNIDCVFQTDELLRKQLFLDDPAQKYCPEQFKNDTDKCLAKNILLYKSRCDQDCHFDCRFKYYSWDLKLEKAMDVPNWQKQLYINVKHNRLPDQIVTHIPETTFISFFSSFGGLLGMWLGMSVLAMYDFVYWLAEKHLFSVNKRIKMFENQFY